MVERLAAALLGERRDAKWEWDMNAYPRHGARGMALLAAVHAGSAAATRLMLERNANPFDMSFERLSRLISREGFVAAPAHAECMALVCERMARTHGKRKREAPRRERLLESARSVRARLEGLVALG